MRSSWEALRAGLLRSIQGREARATFDELKSRSRAFARFETPADLVAAVSPDADLDGRDPVLWALVTASHDRRIRRLSQALLILCLWPALDAMFRRRFLLFPNRPQDLASEIIARFTAEVHRVDPRRVACLTATLLRNTERNVVRARAAERRAAAKTTAVTPDVAVVLPPEPDREASLFGLEANHSETDSVAALSKWLRAALGDDADLVVDAVFHRKRGPEIAASLGISHAAARKRLERALARARAALLVDARSQTAASVALAS
jgi:DNA-directed RNA polymerase specialized sigma24 family protein